MRVFYPYPPQDKYISRLLTLINIKLNIQFKECSEFDFEILVCNDLTQELLGMSSRLEVVIITTSGLSLSSYKVLKRYPLLKVLKTPFNSRGTAEMGLALLLSVAKSIIPSHNDLIMGKWNRYNSIELYKSKVFIMGYGKVGRHLGRLCNGMGMSVIFLNQNGFHEKVRGKWVLKSEYNLDFLHQELSLCDTLFCCLPITDRTIGFIGKVELKMLKNNAIIVNISRAEVFNEQALYSTLKNRMILGAGLDVWYQEDNKMEKERLSNYPFKDLNNVVLSPHKAWSTTDINYSMVEILAKNLNSCLSGDFRNKVDLFKGY